MTKTVPTLSVLRSKKPDLRFTVHFVGEVNGLTPSTPTVIAVRHYPANVSPTYVIRLELFTAKETSMNTVV
jgi:hypothetical protein